MGKQRGIILGLCGALAMSLAGCADKVGGQSGDEPIEIPLGGPGDARCRHEAPVVLESLDEAPAGYSAREIVELAANAGPSELRWLSESPDSSEEPRLIEPTSATETLTFTVAYSGGPIRYFGPSNCSQIQVEVEVTLQTEGKGLDEQVTGVLYALGAEEVGLDLVLHPSAVRVVGATAGPLEGQPLPRMGELKGNLEVSTKYIPSGDAPSAPSSEDATLAAVVVSTIFNAEGASGVLDAWMVGTETRHVFRASNIATFGP